jgi:GH24 family phage-related lysozyme (muramidase)
MGATLAPVRPTATLTAEQRRRLRRARTRADEAEAQLRETVLQLVDEGAAIAAIARDLGVTRQVLWARIRAWNESP